MTKKKSQHHPKNFYLHLARNVSWGLIFIAIALYIGMLGYHFFEHMNWIDAFANASMILSGMGPLSPLITIGGKIFAGFYALFSGLAFILLVGVMFAPIIHAFFKRIHIEASQSTNDE